MNDQAKRHLDKAREYIAQGDRFYWKAGEEVIAAQKADSTLSNGEIGRRFGKGEKWVRTLVTHVTTSSPETSIDWTRGSHATVQEIEEGTKKLLGTAPLEQIEHMVEKLPAKAAAKLAQAALAKPGVTREIAQDAEASATVIRASGAVSEEMVAKAKKRSTIGKRSGLGYLVEVLGNLTAAKIRLRDSYTAARDLDLSDDDIEAVEEVLGEIASIIDWYRSYLTSGDQSFEDELGKLLN